MGILAKGKLSEKDISLLLRDDVIWEFIGKEKDFEDNICEHMDEILEGLGLPPKRLIVQQKQIRFENSQITLDILVQHTDDSMSVFEVKKANTKNPQTSPFQQVGAIGQLMLYRTIIQSVYGHQPRLILIDNKIHYRTMLTIKSNNLPIALMEFQKDFVIVPYVPKEWG